MNVPFELISGPYDQISGQSSHDYNAWDSLILVQI